MKTDRKRKVVEALLCASGAWTVSTMQVAADFGVELDALTRPVESTYRDAPVGTPGVRYTDRQIEAAYRLIESSPTLIREFFHRSAP